MEVKQDIIQNFNYSFQFIKQQYRVLSLFDIFAVRYIGFNIASLHYTHCHLDMISAYSVRQYYWSITDQYPLSIPTTRPLVF